MKIGMQKFPVVCRKHSDAVVYHEAGKACPLCMANDKVLELLNENDTLANTVEGMSAGASQTF